MSMTSPSPALPSVTPIDFPALIRTYVPYAVGAILTWLYLRLGVELRGGPGEVAVLAFSIATVTNIYYAFVRVVETRWPIFGLLLLFPKSPTYTRVDDLFASLVRTWIPPFVSAGVISAIAWLSSLFGVTFAAEWTTLGVTIATAAVSAGYYSAARALVHWLPRLGFLLGVGDSPAAYVARHRAIRA